MDSDIWQLFLTYLDWLHGLEYPICTKVWLSLDVADREMHHLMTITFADLTGGDLGKESRSGRLFFNLFPYVRARAL